MTHVASPLTAPSTAHSQIDALLQQGKLAEVEVVARSCLAAAPGDGVSLHALGVVSLQRGLAAEACALLQRAATAMPQRADYHNDLAVALFQTGKRHEAVLAYRKAVATAQSPSAASIPRRNLAKLLLMLGLGAEALTELRAGEKADPCPANRQALMGALHQLASSEERAGRLDGAAMALQELAPMLDGVGRANCYGFLGGIWLRLERKDQARIAFEMALMSRPDFPEALEVLGTLYGEAGAYAKAASSFETLIRLCPQNASALRLYAGALIRLGRYDEAVAVYQSALRLSPADSGLQALLAEALTALGRCDEALDIYARLKDTMPDVATGPLGLGDTYLTLGRLKDAASAYRMAIQRAPQNPAAYRRLFSLYTVQADDPAWIAFQAMTVPEADTDKAEWHMALAKACRDLNLHEQSFRHLKSGNDYRRKHIHYDEAAALAMIRDIATAFAGEVASNGPDDVLPVFIVGMPRSGTSLVEQILASHPAVYGAGELPVLGQIVAGHIGTNWSAASIEKHSADDWRVMGQNYLERVRPLSPQALRIVDKMPGNGLFTGILRRMLPGARIIHVRRDAMDTCFSCFSQVFWGNVDYAYDLGELGRYYRAYEGLMDHWASILSPAHYTCVRYEDLVTDLEKGARRLIDFCGLDWDERCLRFYETDRQVRTASAAQVRQPLFRQGIGRWKPYATWLGPLQRALSE